MATSTVLIIGGGVIGLSTAYHLARRNVGKVILVDKGVLGDGSSRRAAGIITGLLWSDTGVLARKISLQRFRELSDELPGYRFQQVGCLNLFDPPSWPERLKLLPIYDRLGAPYEILNAAEIHQRWPELTPKDEITGLFDPLGGYSEPDEYIPALAQQCQVLGVELRQQTTVIGFVQRAGRIAGVVTNQGTIEADAVVCTSHIWTNKVLASLGKILPVKAFVHQRYVTTPLTTPVQIPAVNANPPGGYIRPATGNRLLAGGETGWREEWRVNSLEFQMSELNAPASVQAELTEHMTPLWPRLAETSWESERVGLIAFSMDGEPVLGTVAELPGLYLGCAFHSGGFAYNPAVGLLLAELVAYGHIPIDLTAFAPDRFADGPTHEYLETTVIQANAVRRRH